MVIHPELLNCQELLYKPYGFHYTDPVANAESAEYGAYTFALNGHPICFRVAKITPTKLGQFVTFWKRVGTGPIQPYDSSDSFDFFIVCTRDKNRFGQFVFPKEALIKHKIISVNNNGGKRAMRVYPAWVETTSQQAQKTQAWQLEYFLEISPDGSLDQQHLHKIYSFLPNV